MDPVLNPYSPGAGRRPRELVGREGELRLVDALIERTRKGLDGRASILTGLRGVGKTVLLNVLADRAESADWFTVRLEARRSRSEAFEFQLARGLRDAYRSSSWSRNVSDRVRAAARTIRSFALTADASGSLSASMNVEPQRGRADVGNLEVDLLDLSIDLADAAVERRAGVALFIDELQEAPHGAVKALTHAAHLASQANRPFYVLGAGLPSVVGQLSAATSYAERLYAFREIGALSPAQSREVLVEPARAEGVTWTDDALALVVEETAGYPYFLQEFGSAAWDIAPGPRIARSDALAAINDGRRSLDDGFFRARWQRASKSERAYLVAMSKDGAGPSSSADVAARLGKQLSQLGPARANLISKGLVFSPEYGLIAYTVPGMADFIRRQD